MGVEVNTATVVGILGSDPDVRQTRSGVWVRFSVASHVRKKVGDDWDEETHWIRCKAFGDLAQRIADKFHKGDLVSVEGPLRVSEWERDGVTQRSTEIVAKRASRQGKRTADGYQSGQVVERTSSADFKRQPTQQTMSTSPAWKDDEIPF
tara:strand:- start:108 stop:557 length:450 start_codon:yes stop_codon:yes gene_type:complete